MRTRGLADGMTLVELLVALALLAIAAPLAYRGLDGVLQAEARTTAQMARWQGLAFAFERMEADFTQAISRPVRNADGTLLPPWSGGPAGVEFTRAADGRPPLRLRYMLKDDGLWLLQLPLPDRGRQPDPDPVMLVDGIAGLRFSYLDAGGSSVAAWQDPLRLPGGVGLELTLASGERITRFFALP